MAELFSCYTGKFAFDLPLLKEALEHEVSGEGVDDRALSVALYLSSFARALLHPIFSGAVRATFGDSVKIGFFPGAFCALYQLAG